jgi:hypothetical protein
MLAEIGIISGILDAVFRFRRERKEYVAQALKSINVAWTHTYDYLINNKGEYIPNQQLSNLWNTAANDTKLVDVELGSILQLKSRFWIHPELPRQEGILKLKEVIDKTERLQKLL